MSTVASLKRIARRILLGGVLPQSAWEALHRLSLRGMNIGGGSAIDESGELWVIRWLRQRFASTAGRLVIIDAGANVGDYAQHVLDAFGTDAEIYCFEPSPAVFSRLKDRFAGIERVHPIPLGLGSRTESRQLYTNASLHALSSVYKRDLRHVGLELEQHQEIRLVTIDDFCTEHGIGRIHFLKLDTEGHDLHVLMGAGKLLERRSIDVIQFEFGGANIDSRTFFRDYYSLLAPSYDIHRILRHGLRRMAGYAESQEIFTCANYLATARR